VRVFEVFKEKNAGRQRGKRRRTRVALGPYSQVFGRKKIRKKDKGQSSPEKDRPKDLFQRNMKKGLETLQISPSLLGLVPTNLGRGTVKGGWDKSETGKPPFSKKEIEQAATIGQKTRLRKR